MVGRRSCDEGYGTVYQLNAAGSSCPCLSGVEVASDYAGVEGGEKAKESKESSFAWSFLRDR